MFQQYRNISQKDQCRTLVICVVCHRCLYRKSVVLFNESKANQIALSIATVVISFDGKYICCTCNNKVKKGIIPCQVVCNKLEVPDIPEPLA